MTPKFAASATRRCLPRLVRPLTVLDFLAVMRGARPDNEHYYLNGGCWEMFRILRSLWPEAQPYHTWTDLTGHVATKIGEHLYDIRGRVRRPKLYSLMTCETWPSLRGKDHPARWHTRYRENDKLRQQRPGRRLQQHQKRMNSKDQTKTEGGGAVASSDLLASRLRKSEWLDDWYVVDGSWAQPEGTAAEWRMVMDAMRTKRSEQPGRRIGVTVYADGLVEFYSPRNRTEPDDAVRVAANEVEAWLASAEVLLANDKTLPTSPSAAQPEIK